MSHAVHVAKGLHKQAATDHKLAQHHDHVAIAAYYLAEHRGFNGGDTVADWLKAEAEIDAELNKGEGASVH